MYPSSLLYWIGGTAILLGVLGLVGMLVWALETRWKHRHRDSDDAPR